ncbi:MAG: copper-binding protein [Pseudomonadota bacterium]
MNSRTLLTIAVAAALSACGKAQQPANETVAMNQPESAAQEQVYSGTGSIQASAGDQVTIKHGPISGIGWPAMTMTFTVPADLASQAQVGSQVDFSFRKNGSAYQLTSIRKH